MRQVDMYIDMLRAENECLVSENIELRELTQANTGLEQLQPAPERLEMMQPKKTFRVKSAILGALFYIGLAALVFAVYLFGTGNPTGPPRDMAGFSAMTVLTRSMQDVIPQHSLIVTRRVDLATIAVGDDITFLMPNNTTMTHRVIEIHQNYANTGMLGFQTQGTMNDRPDAEVVLEANLVGRVIFHNLALGRGLLFVRENILFVGIMTTLTIAFVTAFVMLWKFVLKKKF